MLDFRVETFLCVCRHMSFTKAAKELNITQPGVSQHIKYLEQYYGTKLFEYNKKQLILTPAGIEFKNAMLSIKHDTSHLMQRINEADGKPLLKFGATLTAGEFFLSEKLAEYVHKNPHIYLDFRIENTSRLLSHIDEGLIDFAIIEGFFNKSEYEYITIKNEDYVAVCASAYDCGNVTSLSDLFPHHTFTREIGSGTRVVLEYYLYKHGYSIKDFSHLSVISSIHIIKELLMAGCGISFLYKSAVEKEIENGTIKVIDIPNVTLSHEFNFIWRKDSIFKEYYKNIYKELFGGTE